MRHGLHSDVATIAQLAAQFGLVVDSCAELTRVARGAMGAVWRLDTGNGSSFAVKELFWGADEQQVRREVAFQDAATDRGVVLAAANHRTRSGSYLGRLPEELGSVSVRLFDWVEGRSARRDDAGRAYWLGRTIGGLHALAQSADGAAVDPWYDTCPDDGRWQTLIDSGHAQHAAWAPQLDAAVPGLRELAGSVRSVVQPVPIICHLDIQPANVLVGPDGRFILLDWENAGPGVPERELAAALLTWHGLDASIDQAGLIETLAAYRAAGGPVQSLSPAAITGLLAGHLNYVDAQASVALEESQSPEMRRHSAEELARLLRNPPSLALLEALRVAVNRQLRDLA